MALSTYAPSVLKAEPLILAFPAILLIIVGIAFIFLNRYFKQKETLLRVESSLASQKNLKTVLDALPIPVRMISTKDANVVYVNDNFVRVFELNSHEDIVGSTIYGLVSEVQNDGISGSEKLKRIFESGNSLQLEVRYRTAKGNFFDALLISCCIDYNGIPCSLGIIRDLTAEKKSQKILLSAVKREQDGNQLKSRILENLSHEIRTPMSAIIGLSETEMYKNLTQETLKIFRAINSSSKNLLQIMDDIISLSDIQLNKIVLKQDEFELDDVLNSALLVVSQHFEGRDDVMLLLNTSLDLPRFITGDKTRLWQILKGFLDNSAKYTKNGKIVLSVSLSDDRPYDDSVYIAFIIKDTGTGSGREQSLNVHDTEYTMEYHGVLAAKRLCSLMGGKLEIEYDSNGALIRFTIPFKRTENNETTMQAIDTPMLSGLNMLLVDDDELSLKIMERLLKCSNVNCVLARSGLEALDIVSKYSERGLYFDVIMLDYMMSDINGLAAAAKIHLSLLKVPKIIIVTAYHKQVLNEKIGRSYVDEVIEKPFVPSQFIQKICATLGIREYSEENSIDLTKYENVCVLICEDNIINQEITAGMVEEFGISYIIADNGKKCLDILHSGQRTDLILMDLYMPVMDGFEATRIIRANAEFDDIPIISLSADTFPQIIEKCFDLGMNGHLSKPVEFDALNNLFLTHLPEEKRIEL